eukprot:8025696-Alexandrium_andersonii.AAC.1
MHHACSSLLPMMELPMHSSALDPSEKGDGASCAGAGAWPEGRQRYGCVLCKPLRSEHDEHAAVRLAL